VQHGHYDRCLTSFYRCERPHPCRRARHVRRSARNVAAALAGGLRPALSQTEPPQTEQP
jgi:hypothetical protein